MVETPTERYTPLPARVPRSRQERRRRLFDQSLYRVERAVIRVTPFCVGVTVGFFGAVWIDVGRLS